MVHLFLLLALTSLASITAQPCSGGLLTDSNLASVEFHNCATITGEYVPCFVLRVVVPCLTFDAFSLLVGNAIVQARVQLPYLRVILGTLVRCTSCVFCVISTNLTFVFERNSISLAVDLRRWLLLRM